MLRTQEGPTSSEEQSLDMHAEEQSLLGVRSRLGGNTKEALARRATPQSPLATPRLRYAGVGGAGAATRAVGSERAPKLRIQPYL
jgi:hypothetical protein